MPINLRSQIRVLNNIDLGTDGIGVDAAAGGPIEVTLPVKSAILANSLPVQDYIKIQIDRDQLTEFIIRTSLRCTLNIETEPPNLA